VRNGGHQGAKKNLESALMEVDVQNNKDLPPSCIKPDPNRPKKERE
jgi:hypothetical protein